jgi:UDP-N-acetylglucosamine 2-epimerase (non-hydrolysing)
MLAFEPLVLEKTPDWVLVVGDVNSTLACTLVCSKLGIKVCHVEAGLRSFDRAMPEEINRIVTDALADLLLTPSSDADENLLKEGVAAQKIKLVGNVMIDTLYKQLPKAAKSNILKELELQSDSFAVTTLHRPSNVDDRVTLSGIIEALGTISKRLPVVFPIHPRTRERIKQFDLNTVLDNYPNIRLIEPLGYLDFLQLYSNSKLVLTDSGGIQEETSVLGITCITLRENTERPITVEKGTNRVIGTSKEKIEKEALGVIASYNRQEKKIPFWDGKAASRIVDAIIEYRS